MNRAAMIYRDIRHHYDVDAADPALEPLLAELLATVGIEGTTCVELLAPHQHGTRFGLVYLLATWDMRMTKRTRADGTCYVYVGLAPEPVSEFEGAHVTARLVARPELEGVA